MLNPFCFGRTIRYFGNEKDWIFTFGTNGVQSGRGEIINRNPHPFDSDLMVGVSGFTGLQISMHQLTDLSFYIGSALSVKVDIIE